ncbi:MerR family transcriptional regulator [Dactylosporangium siamense]|uniref:Transcriptional regulator n=1 Tax=Dactylosporangium siamense TaxID=685454 RepID=A0A919UD00_9ACTN|nr:MerR family transcriptional regulator [Dactylosporangium siamense]GIG47155.1 transcriptional regulator [Dactylosporangium siamense]
MRISELSRSSAVPVPTIKFYLREGLLPPGRATGRNQAQYGPAHLRRLRLIRAFTTISRLDLSTVREILGVLEDDTLPVPELYEQVARVLLGREPEPDAAAQPATGSTVDDMAAQPASGSTVDDLVDQLGWQVGPDAPSRERLGQALGVLRQLGGACDSDFLLAYAEAADRLAVQDLDLLPHRDAGADAERTDRAAAVVRSVMLGVAFTAMRHLAYTHHAALRYRHG